MEQKQVDPYFSKLPFVEEVGERITPRFEVGVQSWYNSLDERRQELLPFMVVPNPLYESKLKIVEYLEKHQLISYDLARDFRLIPSDMTPQKFFKILNEDIDFVFRKVEGLRSDSKIYYEVVE